MTNMTQHMCPRSASQLFPNTLFAAKDFMRNHVEEETMHHKHTWSLAARKVAFQQLPMLAQCQSHAWAAQFHWLQRPG